MKILVTIESVKVARQRQNDDGTWSPVYGIKLVSGDDVIVAESYRTKESLTNAGIVKDAVGTAQIEFKVKEGTSDKTGKDYCFQSITLRDFSLANRNLNNDTQAPATDAAPAAPAADPAPAPQEPAGEQMPSDGVTF